MSIDGASHWKGLGGRKRNKEKLKCGNRENSTILLIEERDF